MDTELLITVSNRHEELESITSQITAFCDRHASLAAQSHRLMLVLEELFSNTIDYGYDADDLSAHEVRIHLTLDKNSLNVVYEDDARPFDPTEAAQADITGTVEERPIGGLGIHLVMTIMSSVSYERTGDCNRLTMLMETSGEQSPSVD